MNSPHWQGAEASRRAVQAAQDSGRLARGGGGGGCLASTILALLIILTVLRLAAPVAWRILTEVGT